MKQLILVCLLAAGLLSCADYGKKVKIEGTKAEIYYKGDGVTEADAKKVGDFLKTNFITSDKAASMQLTKEGDAFTVRFVYDKAMYDSVKGIDEEFKLIAAKISKDVFDGKKVNIALANDAFEDFKTIPFDEAVAKSLDAPPPSSDNASSSKEGFDHDTAGGVTFYWKGITDDESKTIADYIVKNGSFSGGAAEIYMTKDGERYVLRFPVTETAGKDPSYLSKVEEVAQQIKENVFASTPYTFIVMDVQGTTIKSWEY